MFYAGVAVFSLVGCCYLLFHRANAIAPDVTPPVRLRRWTAAFLACITLCHLWYLPTDTFAAYANGAAKDLENKRVMVLDEFDIHPTKESEVKIVDWERTYLLTKYFML